MSSDARAVCSLWFDELAPGTAFATHGRTITEFDIVAFAALTGDCNPQHVDSTFGARSEFGERIAHGALILSYALGIIPIDPDRLIALRGIRDVKFKRPVQIGDTIHVEVQLVECLPMSPEAGLVVKSARVLNERGQLVARMNIETLWRRALAEQAAEHRSA